MRAPVSKALMLATVLAVAVTLGGCGYGPGRGTASSTVAGRADLDPDASLVVATVAVPTGFDPHRERTGGERPYSFPVFDRLTTMVTGGRIEPMLAVSWETAPDAMSMRMTLREGVRFHDGTAFDAEAVRINIDRARTLPDSTVKTFLSTVDRVEVTGPLEVVFHYTAPTPDLVTVLAGPAGAVISPEALADPNRDLRVDPGDAGTGPYLVERFVPSQSVSYVLAPQPNWDPEAGKLAHLEIRFVADDRTRDSAVRAGEVDIAYVNGVVAQSVRQAQLAAQGSTLDLVERPTNVLAALWLRPDRLADPRVREALVRGIDRDAIADGYYQGTCARSAQMSREGFAGHVEGFVDPYPYDPHRARQLLAEAGAAEPLDFELTYAAGREALPVISADNLAGAGVRTELRPATSIEAITAYRTSQTDSFMYAINPMGTLADTVRWIQSSGGLGYQDPALVRLADRAAQAVDDAQRESATRDLVTAVAETAPFVPICHYNAYFLVASDVVGFGDALNGESQYMMDLRSVGRVAEDAR